MNTEDREKIQQLQQTRQLNNDAAWVMCDYLDKIPRAITPQLMQSVLSEGDFSKEMIYYLLMGEFCSLDPENNVRDRLISQRYLRSSVKLLSIDQYKSNPYYKNIKITPQSIGQWSFAYQSYAPYEAFLYRDIVLGEALQEVPQIGFFDSEFTFPVVLENDHEWMAIKPNEINTMQGHIALVYGNVITFGLGMGYFAYMVQRKPEVSSITIVEKDSNVIELFTKYILPQFENPNKVNIIQEDAFEYIEQEVPQKHYDWAFVDLWHDTSDGLSAYLKIRKLEALSPKTRFLYWIEDSIISALRWREFNSIIESADSYSEVLKQLSFDSLRLLATQID